MKQKPKIGDHQKEQVYTAMFPSLTPEVRLAFSLREAAHLLGISYASAYRLCQRGLLRSSAGLRRKLIARDELLRFLKV